VTGDPLAHFATRAAALAHARCRVVARADRAQAIAEFALA